MITATTTGQLYRGDFYATDAAVIELKEAIYLRWHALVARDRSNNLTARVLRAEMRRHAKQAVALARRYRASRS